MKAFSSGISLSSVSRPVTQTIQKHGLVPPLCRWGAGSSGRWQLYLPGSEVQSRRGVDGRSCPKETRREGKSYLIKLVLEATVEGERRHRRMPVGRLRCVEEEGVGPLAMYISSRGHICKCVYRPAWSYK